ncbi:hypothetical protein FRD01_05490 [Microvenator marinus]|uniref:Flp pilus-assembly TadG-like N-terminal domain-containing protein n=1 Tax=Microvenator marinus TaxID=2600177 RepID=A0A5B8XP34_9DELT|nr:hypothetical protein [Microvenator marinus]QED26708.1 hypothetical protein FRD01_05490 [Microvenator marinus]
MLLLLAAFLILFMMAMTLFDAGVAANDKMKVQVAADSASFSHSVVKSRSMNMISYANIIKRMFYSYLATYVNAWVAILAQLAIDAGDCFKLIPNPAACLRFFGGLPMVIMEGIEMIENIPTLMFDSGASKKELVALDIYQRYMFSITPWWAWIEGTSRAMGNGAMVSGSWPPPPSTIMSIRDGITSAAGGVDWALGSGFLDILPSLSQNTDTLPLARRDHQKLWTYKMAPFEFSGTKGAIISGLEYCAEYAYSMEQIIIGAQTIAQSESLSSSFDRRWKAIFVGASLFPAMGCAAAGFAYHDSGYLDMRINESTFEDRNAWLQSTSNVHLAYKPRAGRMDDGADRKKFGIINHEGQRGALYDNSGYFALSRGEIVYKQPIEQLTTGVFSFASSIPLVSNRLGLNDNPDMWSPRWKAKNRPVVLPGESLGSSVQGPDIGLNTMVNDMIAYLILGSVVGIFDDNFGAGAAMDDLFYLLRIGSTFNPGNMEGIVK